VIRGARASVHRPTRSACAELAAFLEDREALTPANAWVLARTPPAEMYATCERLGHDEEQTARALAEMTCLPFLSTIDPSRVEQDVLNLSFCRTKSVLPVRGDGGEYTFVLGNPLDLETVDALRTCVRGTGPLRLAVAPPRAISALLSPPPPPPSTDHAGALRDLWAASEPEGQAEESVEAQFEGLQPRQMAKLGHLPPIVRLVNALLTDAAKRNASDVHVGPSDAGLVVRYRIDGVLVDALTAPRSLQASIISRFKIIARLDISEHRKPQDGRGVLRLGDARIELRVSVLPSQYGETVVARLLYGARALPPLEDLGLGPRSRAVLERHLSAPQGMILVTGPTGSGKTSTLYAALNWLRAPTLNIVSLEDPVEVELPGLTQVQVSARHGVTFASGLRAILRQDPDVILIGEIRDEETARVALEASQTGHLLLSTLHTNDAASSITRLLDLGIDPHLIASSLSLVIAQRLVRLVCPHCATGRAPAPATLARLGDAPRAWEGARWRAGAGCEACGGTGFKGRLAIHEMLEVSGEIRALIAQRAPSFALAQAAERGGMRPLLEDGVDKAVRGMTTLDEVLRVAPAAQTPSAPPSGVPSSAPARPSSRRPEGERSSGRAPASDPLPGGEGARGLILLVEDDAGLLRMLERLLGDAGYQTVGVADGVEALMELGRHAFDLVLSDVNVPHLDGLRLLALREEKGLGVPIMMLTSLPRDEGEQRCLALGAVDYLTKPVDAKVLLIRVGRAIGG
jgi:type II secretory ATPase GspE/PulE/Tfp pilus assembly ATPase PilB-like protein